MIEFGEHPVLSLLSNRRIRRVYLGTLSLGKRWEASPSPNPVLPSSLPAFQVHDIRGFWGERPANPRGTAHRTLIVSFLLFWPKHHKGGLLFNSHSPPRAAARRDGHRAWGGIVGAVASPRRGLRGVECILQWGGAPLSNPNGESRLSSPRTIYASYYNSVVKFWTIFVARTWF